jgi:membrane-bound lytic murein transglycosylase A
MTRAIAVALCVLTAVALISCKSEQPVKDYSAPLPEGMLALEKITDPAQLPDFRPGFGEKESLLRAMDNSMTYLNKPSARFYFPYLDVTLNRAVKSIETFRDILQTSTSADEFHQRILERFEVYRSLGCDFKGTVLFTGYCTPVYRGSLTPTEEFRCPLYKLPDDLVKSPDGTPLGRRQESGEIVSYYTRSEIEGGDLLKGKELAYVASKLEAYIIHVQGSARIVLEDGKELRVGYAGKTDRPYTSVSLKLVADGKIKRDQLSLRKMKEYFAAHPEDVDRYLNVNESYVFFTENDGGPFGSIGVPVTDYRTIATDKQVFPRACLAYVVTDVPRFGADRGIEMKPYREFMLDQDTGGAIRSAGRTDIYQGTGPEAELLAGYTCSEGKLYYIFVKE